MQLRFGQNTAACAALHCLRGRENDFFKKRCASDSPQTPCLHTNGSRVLCNRTSRGPVLLIQRLGAFRMSRTNATLLFDQKYGASRFTYFAPCHIVFNLIPSFRVHSSFCHRKQMRSILYTVLCTRFWNRLGFPCSNSHRDTVGRFELTHTLKEGRRKLNTTFIAACGVTPGFTTK